MSKQQIQNIVLTVLICSSLFFTSQIWFNEKLWPEGYNFFVSTENYSSGESASDDGAELVGKVLTPAHLAVYTVKDFDHAAANIDSMAQDYSLIDGYIKKVITSALEADFKNYVKVGESHWRNALFTSGIYIDYGLKYPTSVFAALIGGDKYPAPEQLGGIRSFAVTAADSLSDNVNVFIGDGAGQYYKVLTKGGKSELSDVVERFSKDASIGNRFSFFLSADTAAAQSNEAVFDPYLILSEDESEAKLISSDNPISENGQIKLSSSAIDKLLNKFGINSATARKHTDGELNLIYVQNDATFKISPDGVIEYKVVSDRQGMSLSPKGEAMGNDAAVKRSIEFAGEINKIMNNPVSELYIRSLNGGEQSVSLGLGYRAAGKSIVFEGKYPGENAVSIEIKDGHLTGYRQIVRNYMVLEESVKIGSTYTAADSIFAMHTDLEKQVENMFVAYADNGGGGQLQPAWFIKLKSSDTYYR